MPAKIESGKKWQTRRVVKPQPRADWLGYIMTAPGVATLCGEDYPDGDGDDVRCPYGQPGDRLWVREAWRMDDWDYKHRDNPIYQDRNNVHYRADEPTQAGAGWRPSIHMPRWASRLLLEITRVRVERLNDITIDDILAEGSEIPVSADGSLLCQLTGKHVPSDYWPCQTFDELKARPDFELIWRRAHFAMSWDRLNADRGFGWNANPWVWAIDFRKV